ncbi:MAG: ABC transporter ATP-binding protein [Rhodospirillaceae bacterium]|jgi:branched-chain amino acid transport system ATP-binding protein|nr:ABC transporter ATP-binding protein [Rhodospirillaceae bacterium]MBT4485931.1 ABC transporter ATP-binding protein [Rhodospirillaceae bacterium]MBT5191307.1 ABC transporter ATP-binding protein [Rhodospirillaceae bacterium]MBT5894312.1 ABC transporter ATP-binding protein [Rhodospirillaceae bacterium]MBT6428511.1 ABC transporter ATP-binding protein [Rhodospirillaceae bacterium]
MALFEAHHLHKRFADQVVLEDITLSFEENQISGIMGPNGAGKTTCFNVLTGRFKPDRGQVRFDGQDITGLPPRKIAGKGIARSFQMMNLFDEYTALENIVLALPEVRARGFSVLHDLSNDSGAQDRGAQVLARIGLAGREHALASDLSYGQRRALEIGIALAAEPRMLFLDEPTSGLGMDATAILAELIGEIRKSVSIVIIEHDMRFLFDLADTIAVIHWGQVIAQGGPDELRDNEWVRASNLGALA